MQNFGIHWFRRDLRIAGNPALRENFIQHQGRVLGFFCIDKSFNARADIGNDRFLYFLSNVKKLREDFKQRGGELYIIHDTPINAWNFLLSNLSKNQLPTLISFCRDYEPYARGRDEEIQQIINKYSIPCKAYQDHLIIEPWDLAKPSDGLPYRVFTPFKNRWLELFNSEKVQSFIKQQKVSSHLINKSKDARFKIQAKQVKLAKQENVLDKIIQGLTKKSKIKLPALGQEEAWKQVMQFKKKITHYGHDRDIPHISGTSRLSHFLKNGQITSAQIINVLNLNQDPLDKGAHVYLSELIWREFYYHILYHYPQVEQLEVQEKYRQLKWENNTDFFKAWCDGKTGFPIVDAGMRELNQTGHMHNRVRMIVASFLTKDLLIDWRWGEKYFMQKLLDGDLAANNGGWQWAASTGHDAGPYFRIFNPWSQSKKFDPQGVYIKTYLPELSQIEAKLLHSPLLDHETYPAPIVDHSQQRLKALKMYKEVT